jgi:hypothetical protein
MESLGFSLLSFCELPRILALLAGTFQSLRELMCTKIVGSNCVSQLVTAG